MNLLMIRMMAGILLGCLFSLPGSAQRLRDTFRRVKQTLVVVRTEKRGVASLAQQEQTAEQGIEL